VKELPLVVGVLAKVADLHQRGSHPETG
jgi:hypothetical protein